MKKIIYIAIISLTCSLAFSSCTEENVGPKTQTDAPGGGGGGSDPIKG